MADDLCRDGLSAVTPPGWFVRSDKPILLPPDGEPEPDEAVIRGSTRDYGRGNKPPAPPTSPWSSRSPCPA